MMDHILSTLLITGMTTAVLSPGSFAVGGLVAWLPRIHRYPVTRVVLWTVTLSLMLPAMAYLFRALELAHDPKQAMGDQLAAGLWFATVNAGFLALHYGPRLERRRRLRGKRVARASRRDGS